MSNDFRDETHTLHSGTVIDLLDYNARYDLTCVEDCHEAMSLLERKAIEIEFQLEMIGMGHHPDGEPVTRDRPMNPTWLPRAKKALAMTRLQKSTTQQQIQYFASRKNAESKEQRAVHVRDAFIDRARLVLPEETFNAILDVAVSASGGGARKVTA